MSGHVVAQGLVQHLVLELPLILLQADLSAAVLLSPVCSINGGHSMNQDIVYIIQISITQSVSTEKTIVIT